MFNGFAKHEAACFKTAKKLKKLKKSVDKLVWIWYYSKAL